MQIKQESQEVLSARRWSMCNVGSTFFLSSSLLAAQPCSELRHSMRESGPDQIEV
jgi:hypothetical protein